MFNLLRILGQTFAYINNISFFLLNSTTTSSLETTKSKNIGNDPNSTTLDTPINDKEVVTINIENNTTDNARKSTDQKKFGNESVDTNSNTDWITSTVAISLGILFPACVIGILSIYYKKGKTLLHIFLKIVKVRFAVTRR